MTLLIVFKYSNLIKLIGLCVCIGGRVCERVLCCGNKIMRVLLLFHFPNIRLHFQANNFSVLFSVKKTYILFIIFTSFDVRESRSAFYLPHRTMLSNTEFLVSLMLLAA